MGPPLQGMYPLIRPSVRTGAPSPKGEGFGTAQIGRDSALCGTFGYIYWEFGWSAPVGRRAARVCRPYGGDVANPGGASRRPRPTKGAAGAQCESLHGEGAGNLAPHPSGLRPGHLPPRGKAWEKQKGQVLDLPLKTQRRNAVSQKVLLPTFLSRKVGGRNFSQKLPCFSPLLSNLIRKCKFSFRRLDTAPLGEYHRNDTNLRQNTGRRGIFTPGARGGLPCGEDF